MTWGGFNVDEVATHTGAAAINHGSHERNRDARRCERDDGERTDLTGGLDWDLPKSSSRTAGTRVASIEEAGAARLTLVCDQMRVVAQDEVVDVGDCRSHGVILALCGRAVQVRQRRASARSNLSATCSTRLSVASPAR